ncbi:unnamed protein product [Meloidogyne enterolobii]|uniref:Uncharacterized protein n=1 Tax=Meloidogyne enterolobii TaxID=390850 RepID=A0ACB0Y567_MELEN
MNCLEFKLKGEMTGEMEEEMEEALLKIYAVKRKIEHYIEYGLFASELKKLYIFFFKKQFLKTLILYSQLYNKVFNEIQEEERQFTDNSFFLTSLLSEMNNEILKIVNVRSPNLNELIRNKFTKMSESEENIENYLIKNLKESNGEYEEIPQFEGYEEENGGSAGRNDSGKEEIGNSLFKGGNIFRKPTGGKNAWQGGVGSTSNNVGKEIRKSLGGKKYGEEEKVGKDLIKVGKDIRDRTVPYYGRIFR